MLSRDWEVKVVHVYREANFAQSWLAAYARSRAVGYHLISDSLAETQVHQLRWRPAPTEIAPKNYAAVVAYPHPDRQLLGLPISPKLPPVSNLATRFSMTT
ncbi:uncharacterized protein LOC112534549 [Ricinus communis]|uniref:uncharacterized protein LOC112534549 n=1 Tax=Ricinus communis TaxID=3988 RepID=UPI00201AC25D|nr:uncharacterized protein LOC112534549 [Ricinus communis]